MNMKLIKTLVTMAIINAIVVIALVGFSFPKKTLENPLVSPEASYSPVLNNEVLPSPSLVPISTPVTKVSTSSAPAPTKTPSSTATPVATVQPTPVPTPSGCIVTIDSVKYDVTRLRSTHSGGDIFSCGTDMSQTFWSRHNNRILQRMQQYKI